MQFHKDGTAPANTGKIFVFGSNLAGHCNEEIAPLFKGAPNNCSFAAEWAPFLEG